MSDMYVLNGQGDPQKCDDLLEWGRLFEKPGLRQICRDELESPFGTITVSTVFLAIDHAFEPGAPPILWESMAFLPRELAPDDLQERYRTRAEAVAGHKKMLQEVRELIKSAGGKP